MNSNDSSKCYMLDTNVFDHLVKGRIKFDQLPTDGKFLATPVQLVELKNCKDDERRAKLLSKFGISELVPAGFSFGVAGAGWGEGEWHSEEKMWLDVKNELDLEWEKLPKDKKERSKKENNLPDASIAEAAHFHGCVLLTQDCTLDRVAAKHGITVLRIALAI
jgi:hypothetical protein